MVITGGQANNLNLPRCNSHDDHRIAMALAVLGAAGAGIEIENSDCVNIPILHFIKSSLNLNNTGDNMTKSVIAIDGPAGAGKSTIAKMAAQKLGYIYIDTGAMYRAVAWRVLQEYTPPVSTEQIISVLDDINIKLSYDENKNMRVETNGTDVSAAIRTPEVTALVSQVAAVSEVRTKMVELQRAMAKCGKVLMDGRDIGTCVLPNADLKIFLTASVEERANRRARQMKEKGYDIDVEEIKKDIIARDEADMNREISPLKKADDALLLDTTEMTIEEVLAAIVKMAQD